MPKTRSISTIERADRRRPEVESSHTTRKAKRCRQRVDEWRSVRRVG
jgi:hypothetical protein